MCDNPRVSQIVGHMTGRPSKFCRVCLVCYLYTDIGYTAKTHTHGEFGKLEASRKLQKLSDVLIYCKCEQSCALGCLLDGRHYQL
ncbi:hypothetical protein EMCRGX_G018817 [Ephydatia muelleri]